MISLYSRKTETDLTIRKKESMGEEKPDEIYRRNFRDTAYRLPKKPHPRNMDFKPCGLVCRS